ncbi:MAG: DUF1989 domain-containing protein [Rhodobacteraceae bacterium]|nr:DUF1989 domain-containing protein [Paracoccaceae bacterium]
MKAPKDADARRAVAPVVCYPNDTLYKPPLDTYRAARAKATQTSRVTIPPREARCFYVTAGSFFRISCPEGAQVGDLNLFEARNLDEHFYSGKTRALHGSHINVGDRLWSCLPYLRPMATVLTDSLDWYGVDEHGGRVHDVIGTRCDPYTHHLLTGQDYHHTCHSNLTRALATHLDKPLSEAELLVHDVLNVFMCTGFTQETGQYFMKASPARKGDYIEFFAEIDLLCALSACPGGDCGTQHSSDSPQCHPLDVTVYAPPAGALDGWYSPSHNRYSRRHSHD